MNVNDRWPREFGMVGPNLKHPSCENLTVCQWVEGFSYYILEEPDMCVWSDMITYLAKLMQDASHLSWTKVKRVHAYVMSEMEMGNISWKDPVGVDRARQCFTQNMCKVAPHDLTNKMRGESMPPPAQCPFSGNMAPGRPRRAIALKNIMDEQGTFTDTLHKKAVQSQTSCNSFRCVGSKMVDIQGYPNKMPRSKEETLEQAKDFIHQYYSSINSANKPAHTKRWKEVSSSINKTGTYDLTYDELVFGSKTAWRNAPRCIGRIQWKKLQVFDYRNIKTPKEMFDALMVHLKYATNGGNLRSAITVFPQRKFGTTDHDFKIWNSLLVGYAGYKKPDGSIVGDPKSVEITELLTKMGWKGKGGMFDILPLLLQADGNDPEWFDIPPELALQVSIEHPKFPKFAELGLKWIAVPGVANMCFDCGGLEFTGCQFSGWYMSTEVAARDLCDTGRYNVLRKAAEKFDIPTGGNTTLWQDRTLIEVNIAVLHSYNKSGVTIMDHHSASESFMTHLANEQKDRGGCPADWVWIVPPMSSSVTQVFHQEMLNYKLRPSYEYQDVAWLLHQWQEPKNVAVFGRGRRKSSFQAVAKAVLFANSLMKKTHAQRAKCTILYATETGRSEMFAKRMEQLCKRVFHCKRMCMKDYNIKQLPTESLLLVISSTFGNGDPPENGESFERALHNYIKSMGKNQDKASIFGCCRSAKIQPSEPPLANSQFSVFGLGSRAYPQFCQFAHTIKQLFYELGGRELYPVGEGDELEGQEEPFNEWATEVFRTACLEYGIDEDEQKQALSLLGRLDSSWTSDRYKVSPVDMSETELTAGLSQLQGKPVGLCTVQSTTNLQAHESDRQTMLVVMKADNPLAFNYLPGDHVAVYPSNRESIVEKLLEFVTDCKDFDQVLRLHRKDVAQEDGVSEWKSVNRLPRCSIRQALTHYLDITTPPSQKLVAQLALVAQNNKEQEQLKDLSKDLSQYNEWRDEHWPNLFEVISSFPSLKLPVSLLLSQLPLLQPRYYSISSSLKKHPGEIHITVAVLEYTTPAGVPHQGLCSKWLSQLAQGESVPCFIRTASGFHMADPELPMILIGPGTGIAPFRSFWQDREADKDEEPGKKFGALELYFGCRSQQDNIYNNELVTARNQNVLSDVHLALSRDSKVKKTYVQNLVYKHKQSVYNTLKQKGHMYVCGAVTMAAEVKKTIVRVIQEQGKMSEDKAKEFFSNLKLEGHYHEDIFGASFGTTFKASAPKATNGTSNGHKVANGQSNHGYQSETKM